MHISKDKMKDIDRLKKRSDFLCVQKSNIKWVSRSFVLQVRPNNQSKSRFGLTVSKKVSKLAVTRNRIKRRFRSLAFEILPDKAVENMDYVLVARIDADKKTFSALQKELVWCLGKLDLLKNKEEAE